MGLSGKVDGGMPSLVDQQEQRRFTSESLDHCNKRNMFII